MPLSWVQNAYLLTFGGVVIRRPRRRCDTGWTDPVTLVVVLGGLLLLGAFVAIERRAPQPIMPLRLFSSRQRNGAYTARLLLLGAMAPFWFFTTQFPADR